MKAETRNEENLGKGPMVMGVCAFLAASPVVAFASEKGMGSIAVATEQENQIKPRVNWSGSAYLTKEQWCNVTSSNNIFPDSPKVTNNAGNPGKVKFRIVNSSGATVGKSKECEVGYSVTMDKIPSASGTYTLQAFALSGSGTYTIAID